MTQFPETPGAECESCVCSKPLVASASVGSLCGGRLSCLHVNAQGTEPWEEPGSCGAVPWARCVVASGELLSGVPRRHWAVSGISACHFSRRQGAPGRWWVKAGGSSASRSAQGGSPHREFSGPDAHVPR